MPSESKEKYDNIIQFLRVNLLLYSNRIYTVYPRNHDDVIKWRHFPRYWPFVRGIHRSPVTSPHKGQWRGALMFSLICAWMNDWVNNRDAGDLRRHRAHYDVTVILCTRFALCYALLWFVIGSFYPYCLGLFDWHRDKPTFAPRWWRNSEDGVNPCCKNRSIAYCETVVTPVR